MQLDCNYRLYIINYTSYTIFVKIIKIIISILPFTDFTKLYIILVDSLFYLFNVFLFTYLLPSRIVADIVTKLNFYI